MSAAPSDPPAPPVTLVAAEASACGRARLTSLATSAVGGARVPTTIDVRFYELDPYGHVNHGVYLNYFEVARIELLDAIGFGLPRLQQLGYHLLVVEATVRFRAPATAGDRLVIHSDLVDLRRASAVWHQRALRDEVLVAENEVRSAITDRDGRPCKAPPELMAALEQLAALEPG
jgi:acyl-CoA thioester hydrolase